MGLPQLAKLLEETILEESARSDSRGNSSLDEVRSELLDGAGRLAAAARRVMRWQAMLTCLAVGLAVLLLLMLGDMLLRREELGLRVLSLLAWLLVLGWSVNKWLRPAWRFSLTPVQVAQWIEGERPELEQRLSTAVELAHLPAADTRFGSSLFRDAALRAWSASGSAFDWSRHLEQRGLRRAGGLLLAVGGVIAALWIVWPMEMRLAFARLAVPWSAHAWPHRDQLHILQLPTVVAAGSELQLEVVDERPPLPDRVELQVREVDAAQTTHMRTLETTLIGDLAVGNLPSINATFEVRAVGGDDQRMPWQRVEVVQPPELTEFQFTVDPPEYAGLRRSEVIGHRITVLAGSQVEFRGRFDRPVAQVVVEQLQRSGANALPNVDPNADASAPTQQPWTVRLDDDGRGLHLSGGADAMLAVQESLDWQLSITTADGLETRLAERWSIEVTEDTPPRVIFQTADLAELASNAQLILRGSAADDLGLVAVRGRLQLVGDTATPAASLSIWQAVQSDDDRTPTAAIREFAIDAPWSIAQVGSFVAGQHLAVWLEACDNSGQWSQSQVQEFAIRDQRELIESIQEKQNQLLTQVRELVDTQRRNTQLFSRTWEMAHQAGKLGREQIDLFRNTAEVQRAVAERLGGSNGPQGIKQEIAKLSDLLTRNRLDETELAAELNVLAGNLRKLSDGAMEEATTTTAQTAVLAESTWKDDAAIAPDLTASAAQSQAAQSAALRGLEKLLDRLARNESLQQIERELAQILNQQNAIRRETNRLHLEGLADRSEESRAQLQLLQTALSADQQGLARRLDDWLSRVGDLQQSETADQQTAKSALARATQSLSSAQASGLMRRSTEEIRDSQLARAATTQQQVSELLSDTLRQLGAGNQSQLGGLRNRAEGLRQLSTELSDLATVQSALSERWQASPTASTREQLLSDQANAEQRTRAAANQADQAGDGSLSSEIDRASADQQLAQSAGRQNDFQQATRASQQAAQQLEQTSQQLEQRAAGLEQQVAEQQMFQLAIAIERVSTQQKPITEQFNQWANTETNELPQASRQSYQAEVRQAASRQEEVRQMLREVRAETSAVPTFDWTLEQAELLMGRAVAAAKRYRVAPDAEQASEGALRLLQLAADAMREQRPGDTSDASPPIDGEENPDGEKPPAEVPQRPAPFVASLILLRSLQQELNAQTVSAQGIDDSVRRTGQLSELANMQQALATQIEQLLRESSPPAPAPSEGN